MIQYQVKKINNLKERYIEVLLKQTELTMKENIIVMKKLNLGWIKHSLSIRAYAC